MHPGSRMQGKGHREALNRSQRSRAIEEGAKDLLGFMQGKGRKHVVFGGYLDESSLIRDIYAAHCLGQI